MTSQTLSILLPNWRKGAVPCLLLPQTNPVAAQNIRADSHGGATFAVAGPSATTRRVEHE